MSRYYACSDGRIYSEYNRRFRQLTEFRHPYAKYLSVYLLRKGNDKVGVNVHKLIASAFYRINLNRYRVIHRDKNLLNNKPENLNYKKLKEEEIATQENTIYQTNIMDYEAVFKSYINFDYQHPDWLKYQKIKSKKSNRVVFNWLTVYLKTKKLM